MKKLQVLNLVTDLTSNLGTYFNEFFIYWNIIICHLFKEKLQTKCLYDERMFADTKSGSKSRLDANDTEEDYFEIMKNMNDDKRKVQLT